MAARKGGKMALSAAVRRCGAVGVRNALGGGQQVAAASTLSRIGNRDVVGFGLNGQANYIDRVDVPMPAIRFKENTPDVMVLREKEKGDWNKLTLEEKKTLYRASFCQTFVEIKAPSGEWKSILGISLIASSFAIWIYVLMKVFVYDATPDSMSKEKQEAQLKRMIDLRANPIQGTASMWDYEKGDWK